MPVKTISYRGYLYTRVPVALRYAGAKYVLVTSYWTPPASPKAARARAKDALLFLQKNLPLLRSDKIDDALEDVFRTSFSSVSYPLTRILEYDYVKQFDSSHEHADTYSQLARWLNTEGVREKLAEATGRFHKFVADVKARQLYDWTSSTEVTVDPMQPLSDVAVRAAGDSYDDDEEGKNFAQDVLPFFEMLRQLPAQLKLLDDYMRSIEYRRDLVNKKLYQDKPGDPRPNVENREIVWHATTALPAIMREGFKTREELGEAAGLGGATKGISFTGSLEIAEQIVQAILDVIQILQGPRTLEAIFAYAHSLGIEQDELLKFFGSAWGGKPKVDADGKVALEDAFNLVRFTLAIADQQGTRYDPLFFDTTNLAKKFSVMDPKNVGVVEAVIDTTLPEVDYLHSMEEWRVPISGILSYGPVGSQSLPTT